ncbi:MAG: TIGR03936 family radical SAM-associated protein [Anaerolineales bacterium]|jgi:radical SAM-linked protein
MSSKERFRYRVVFAKTEAMRYTGHLDLYHTLERTLRRAQIPLAYSEGFNPRPRINLGAPLPLGCTSQREMLDLWLEQALKPKGLLQALHGAAPPGIRIESASAVPSRQPTLQSQITSATYEVILDGSISPETLRHRIAALLEAAELPRKRRNKRYDLRPLIEELAMSTSGDRARTIRMRLVAREGATGRADEVIRALGLDPADCQIMRTQLHLIEPNDQPS